MRDPSVPSTLPLSPIISAERETACREEAEIGWRNLTDAVRTSSVSTMRSDASATLSGGSSATISSSDDGEDEIPPPPAYVLPDMISKAKDNLCTKPSDHRHAVSMTFKPGTKGRYTGTKLRGTEWVTIQVHELSERLEHGGVHRVGIDSPWVPSAAAPGYTVQAHLEHAARFFENSVRNTLPAQSAASDADDEDEGGEEDAPVRQIRAEDVHKPFPTGPSSGEEFTIANPPALERPKASPRNNRPTRPLGALDPAEMCYYQHMQRKKTLAQLISQGMLPEEAVALLEEWAAEAHGVVRTWAELEGEAETAEMVLRVYGKLPPMEGRVEEGVAAPTPPSKRRKKGEGSWAPKGKGRARAVASSRRVAGATSLESGAGLAGSSQDEEADVQDSSTSSGASSAAGSSQTAPDGSESEEVAPREKRKRKLTAKAQEAEDEKAAGEEVEVARTKKARRA